MRRLFGILAFLLLLTPGLAVAIPSCSPDANAGPSSAIGPTTVALVFVNGTCFNFSDSVKPIGDGKVLALSGNLATDEGLIQFHAVMNSDPVVNFGATTTNVDRSRMRSCSARRSCRGSTTTRPRQLASP